MSTTSPAKARPTIAAITEAMQSVRNLETRDSSIPTTIYDHLLIARNALAVYVSDEWDKSRTMECGAD